MPVDKNAKHQSGSRVGDFIVFMLHHLRAGGGLFSAKFRQLRWSVGTSFGRASERFASTKSTRRGRGRRHRLSTKTSFRSSRNDRLPNRGQGIVPRRRRRRRRYKLIAGLLMFAASSRFSKWRSSLGPRGYVFLRAKEQRSSDARRLQRSLSFRSNITFTARRSSRYHHHHTTTGRIVPNEFTAQTGRYRILHESYCTRTRTNENKNRIELFGAKIRIDIRLWLQTNENRQTNQKIRQVAATSPTISRNFITIFFQYLAYIIVSHLSLSLAIGRSLLDTGHPRAVRSSRAARRLRRWCSDKTRGRCVCQWWGNQTNS